MMGPTRRAVDAHHSHLAGCFARTKMIRQDLPRFVLALLGHRVFQIEGQRIRGRVFRFGEQFRPGRRDKQLAAHQHCKIPRPRPVNQYGSSRR
jgi:hypothetical protein